MKFIGRSKYWLLILILVSLVTKMASDEIKKSEIFHPETIVETPFPGQEGVSQSFSEGKDGVFSPSTIKPSKFPVRTTAHELLSSSLNTKSRKILAEFEFTPMGAIQIGKYENGVSGDLRITPSGITARDSAGLTTFSIDGTTGDAVFKGSIQAGSLITGIVSVGDNNIVIDGDNRRMVFYDENDVPVILIGNS